jgi:hypothetical protein
MPHSPFLPCDCNKTGYECFYSLSQIFKVFIKHAMMFVCMSLFVSSPLFISMGNAFCPLNWLGVLVIAWFV